MHPCGGAGRRSRGPRSPTAPAVAEKVATTTTVTITPNTIGRQLGKAQIKSVTEAADGSAITLADFEVYDGDTLLYTTRSGGNANGSWSQSFDTVGTHTITVKFLGGDTYASSQGTATIEVTEPTFFDWIAYFFQQILRFFTYLFGGGLGACVG